MFLQQPQLNEQSIKANKSSKSKSKKKRMSSQSQPAKTQSSSFRSPRKLRATFGGYSWHKDIALAQKTHQWETVRQNLDACTTSNGNYNSSGNASSNGNVSLSSSANSNNSSENQKKSFWSRISGKQRDKTGLLQTSSDELNNTPLHCMLSSSKGASKHKGKAPTNLVLQLIALEPRAASVANARGRLPLHFAVVHRAHLSVIAALVDAHPAAIASVDSKGSSPLQYAVDIAKRETVAAGTKGNKLAAPRTYWMPFHDSEDSSYCEEIEWQQQQAERWGVVHWLLLASATHPQTSLSVGDGGKSKPMLVDALLHAASPAVISLLVGASVMLLSHESKATAFAGSTLYSCVTRHYPATILQSLANQCPRDVTRVRDETGMGLVAAQFLSGCFEQISVTQDWTVSEDFYACLLECVSVGEIGDDPALQDWWQKIEFLIGYCSRNQSSSGGGGGGGSGSSASGTVPKQYLLHAALSNTDTPPLVFQMLLALYPASIFIKDRKTGALPLHMICTRHDYIPRNYEINTTGQQSVLEIVLQADPLAVNKRHKDRLPLHLAVASGRMIPTLRPLLQAAADLHDTVNHDDDEEEEQSQSRRQQQQLLQRDPQTHLYPFMQAASYPNRSDEDSFRWTCLARNKYSHVVWQGLSDRQKASAVLKVQEQEELARLDTVYELLRMAPCAIHWQQHQEAFVAEKQQSKNDTRRLGRATSGSSSSSRSSSIANGEQNPVSSLYISWCFTERVDDVQGQLLEPNVDHQAVLRHAVRQWSSKNHTRASLPPEFDQWWSNMKARIWRSSQKARRQQSMRQHDNFDFISIPNGADDKYRLHAALINSDTPPEIVELLMAASSDAVFRAMPNTSVLPLHMVSRTPSYIPSRYERYHSSSLDLVLQAYPQAARVLSGGQLPLHMAILAGKSCRDIESIVETEPGALFVKELTTNLYPFQLMALRHEYSAEQRLRFQRVARNQFEERDWSTLTPQECTQQVQQVQRNYELNRLSSVFLMLRREPLVADQRVQKESDNSSVEDASESQSAMASYVDSAVMSSNPKSLSTRRSDVTEEDESSFCAVSRELLSPAARRPSSPSSLMLLLSQHHRSSKHTPDDDDIYECDASVFSNVDVMSTLTSTIHTLSRHTAERVTKAPVLDMTDEGSIDIFSYARAEEESSSSDESSSYDDFAEESVMCGSSMAPSKGSIGTLDDTEESNGGYSSDEESVVVFEIRKVPRFSSGKLRDSKHTTPSSVKLSKRAPKSLLVDLKAHSLSSREVGTKMPERMSIVSKASSSDKNSYPSRFSYKSLHPEEISKMAGSAKDMIWMDRDLLAMHVQGNGSGSSIAESSVSLSLATSQHEPAMSRARGGVAGPSSTTTSSSLVSHPSFYSAGHSKTGRSNHSRNGSKASPSNALLDAFNLSDVKEVSEHHSIPHMTTGDSCQSVSDLGSNDNEAKLLGSTSSSSAFDDDLLFSSAALKKEKKTSSLGLGKAASGHAPNGSKSSLFSAIDDSSTGIDDMLLNLEESSHEIMPKKSQKGLRKKNLPGVSEQSLEDRRAEQSGRYPVASQAVPVRMEPAAGKEPVAPVSDKYFDKTTMRWMPKVSEKPEMAFDKQSMRWIPKSEVIGKTATGVRAEQLQLKQSATPFVYLVPSSASHTVKPKPNGRSRFQGRAKTSKTAGARNHVGSSYDPPQQSLVCLLCKNKARQVLMVPCRHLCMCRGCSIKHANMASCPLCSCAVTGRMLIF